MPLPTDQVRLAAAITNGIVAWAVEDMNFNREFVEALHARVADALRRADLLDTPGRNSDAQPKGR